MTKRTIYIEVIIPDYKENLTTQFHSSLNPLAKKNDRKDVYKVKIYKGY